jgi:hypothetical protein
MEVIAIDNAYGLAAVLAGLESYIVKAVLAEAREHELRLPATAKAGHC